MSNKDVNHPIVHRLQFEPSELFLSAASSYSVARAQTAADVDAVIGQLDVLRETLPAITSSDLFPKATQAAVALAATMLANYRDRLMREEEARKLSAAGAEAVRVDKARAEGFKAGVESVKAKAKKAKKK